jgi:hypothetical protein
LEGNIREPKSHRWCPKSHRKSHCSSRLVHAPQNIFSQEILRHSSRMGGPPSYGRRKAAHAAGLTPHGWHGASGTLGQMCSIGIRSVVVRCKNCRHGAIINADRWTDDSSVRLIGTMMLCTKCNPVGADVRPDWDELLYIAVNIPAQISYLSLATLLNATARFRRRRNTSATTKISTIPRRAPTTTSV